MLRKFDTIITEELPTSNGTKHYRHTPATCFIDIDDIAFMFPTEVEGHEKCFAVNLKSGATFIVVNVDEKQLVDPTDVFLDIVSAGYDVCNRYYEYDEMATADMSDLVEAIGVLQQKLDRSEMVLGT